MKFLNLLFVAYSLMFFQNAYSFGNMEELFENHFYHGYEDGYCGQNSMAFVAKAEQNFGNANTLSIIKVKNKGYSVFGMINAEKARSAHIPPFSEKNWHYHAFVMDNRGMVYDSDFDGIPRVVFILDYLNEMFLIEPECSGLNSSNNFCVGSEEKLENYIFTTLGGLSAINRSSSQESSKIPMKNVFTDWRILIGK